MKAPIQIILTLLLLSQGAWAQDPEEDPVELPVVTPPPGFLDEGTQTQLTDQQVKGLLDWAKDTEGSLRDLLASIRRQRVANQRENLVQGLTQIVLESRPERSETILRFVVDRGLKILPMLNKKRTPGSYQVDIDWLRKTAMTAIGEAPRDADRWGSLQNPTQSPVIRYAGFGVRYARMVYRQSLATMSLEGQLAVLKTGLGLLAYDLYRDPENVRWARTIVKLDRVVKSVPADAGLSPERRLTWIKQLKQEYMDALSKLADAEAIELGHENSARETSCGLQGSADARIEDCASRRGFSAAIHGWQLVSRKPGTGEVWLSEDGVFVASRPDLQRDWSGTCRACTNLASDDPELYGISNVRWDILLPKDPKTQNIRTGSFPGALPERFWLEPRWNPGEVWSTKLNDWEATRIPASSELGVVCRGVRR